MSKHLYRPMPQATVACAWAAFFCTLSYGQAIPHDFLTITPIVQEGGSAQELGYAASKINSTAFKEQSLTTVTATSGGRYQFTSYYDADQQLVVGRRKQLSAGWSDWTLRTTEFRSFNINDSHNVSSIAIDGDGFLHVSWGMHNNPLLYTRSTTSLTNDAPITLVGDTVGNNASLGAEITNSTNVTYPIFYDIPTSGDVLFSYRTGTSGNGNLNLVRWNNDTNAWSDVRGESGAPWIDGELPGDGLPSANAYTNYAAFDTQGNMHVSWTWRTGSDSQTPFKDYQSNHNILYAVSPNQGVDWLDANGTPLQRSGQHAIDESNTPAIVTIPEGSSHINQTHMTTGPDDTVYIAGWWAPNADQGDHLRQYMLSWNDGQQWHTSPITERTPENVSASGVSQRVPENRLRDFRMTRPIVAVDDEDRVIVAFTDWQRGKQLSLAYSEDSARDDWQVFDLPTGNMGSWEPNLDLSRWKEDGVISMLLQVEDNGQVSSGMSILEWDALSYFSEVQSPFVFGDLNSNGVLDVGDYSVLNQFSLANLSGLHPADQYRRGDLDGDGDNDLYDFVVFRSLFASTFGAGALEKALTQAPEPAAALLLSIVPAICLSRRHRLPLSTN